MRQTHYSGFWYFSTNSSTGTCGWNTGGVSRIFGMTQKIAFVDELETGGFDLLAQRALLDAMQGLADRGAVAGARGMIRDDQEAAGLQRREHLAVHLGAIDRHVGRVVIGEEERDQVEPGDIGRNRIVKARTTCTTFFMAGFWARISNLSLTTRSITSAKSCA